MQVEILGVPLPWKSIFSNEDSDASFIQRLNGHSKDKDAKHLAGARTSYRELASINSVSSTNSLVDLLTGEVVLPSSVSQPVAETVIHEGGDLLSFLDDVTQPVSDGNNYSKIVSPQEPTDDGSKQYIRLFKLLAGPHWVCLC